MFIFLFLYLTYFVPLDLTRLSVAQNWLGIYLFLLIFLNLKTKFNFQSNQTYEFCKVPDAVSALIPAPFSETQAEEALP